MKTRPDLVILDVNMPGGNGLAVCGMLASDPHYAGIPVIIHTSQADTATRQRCQHLGARYVEKSPQSWAEIGSLVESLIGGARSETEMAEPAPVEATAQLTLPTCGRVRVLCIDGPKGELESVQRELVALGVDTVRASDLEQGYWTCFTEKPHVLVIHTDAPKEELERLSSASRSIPSPGSCLSSSSWTNPSRRRNCPTRRTSKSWRGRSGGRASSTN